MNMKKLILILAISALILTGLALLVGTLFESNNAENVTVEEVVFLPYQNEITADTQTMSYGMAAKFSDGSIGPMGSNLDTFVDDVNTEPETEYRTRDVPTRGEEIFEFSNCSATGRYGPSQGQVDNTYSGSTLEGSVVRIGNGIQQWEIPGSGQYVFEVAGAESGRDGYNQNTGNGAIMRGTFELDEGDVLKILVGQRGDFTGYCCGAAGGGGTFVTYSDNTPLIIAGGGGGYRADWGGLNSQYQQGTTEQNGQWAYWNGECGPGGTNGNGGGRGCGGCGGGGELQAGRHGQEPLAQHDGLVRPRDGHR